MSAPPLGTVGWINWVLNLPIRTPGRKFVMIALASHADAEGYCTLSQKRIADLTGQTDRTVRRHLKALEAEGYIACHAHFGDDGTRLANIYEVNWERRGAIFAPLPGKGVV